MQKEGRDYYNEDIDSGDNGDPYPGSTFNRFFDDNSFPNSNDYNGDDTFVSVNNISDAGSNMTADLGISSLISPPDIDVSALSFTFELFEGSITSDVLTISNMSLAGSQDLTWDIAEENIALVLDNRQTNGKRIYNSGNFQNINPVLLRKTGII